MKILYVTIKDRNCQGDYLEIMALRSLRSVLGENCIDYPRKKILYNDWSEVSKQNLHGQGFTIIEPYLKEIDRKTNFDEIDVIVYGFVNKPHYVNDVYPELKDLKKPIFFIDGHDDPDILIKPCFKHELHKKIDDVFPMNLAIPSSKIREIDLSIKNQIFQKTAPPYSLFGPQVLGQQGRQLYIFNNEKDYYDDMAKSWFGLSCRKGSWDALRNYEIIASGALLLFRDFSKKPKLASPVDVPAISYSTKEELQNIINTLLPNGNPTVQYEQLLEMQRDWLLNNATEEKVGEHIVSVLKNYLKSK